MLKLCVQTVVYVGEILGKSAYFCALSTHAKALNNVYINLCAYFAQVVCSFEQLLRIKSYTLSHLIFKRFYPLSTGPINTTNYIKE